ncbi:unnamed protein product [Hymenolepis diminuta]|uniref:Alpha-2-macroglobulin domain-containing protein n=1 Tax=Hymenolepis diminuta TaxID=6216 RepID=A0A564XUS7_HYMDI|nr:unnamed protein product [Hymenolepis diminuta]
MTQTGFQTQNAFRAAGIDFTLVTANQYLVKSQIVYPTRSPRSISLGGRPIPVATADEIKTVSFYKIPRPRLHDYFPKVWLFESVMVTNGGFEKSLTVPDGLNSWEANAVWFLGNRGLWAPVSKPSLISRMSFFVEFTTPTVVRRDEILHLTITIFLRPEENAADRTCYEVELNVKLDPKDWRIVGASVFLLVSVLPKMDNKLRKVSDFR